MATARRSPHYRSLDQVQVAEIAGALGEAMPIVANEVPTAVSGTLTGRGMWRRIKAVYASGWVVVVNFRKDGSVSSTSASMSLKATVPAHG